MYRFNIMISWMVNTPTLKIILSMLFLWKVNNPMYAWLISTGKSLNTKEEELLSALTIHWHGIPSMLY